MFDKVFSTDSLSESYHDRKKKLSKHSVKSLDDSNLSKHSIFGALHRFDLAVQSMEKTILVPSRLIDMHERCESGGPPVPPLPHLLLSSDAYDVFQMLRSMRQQLRVPAASTAETAPSLSGTQRSCSLTSGRSFCSSEGSSQRSASLDDVSIVEDEDLSLEETTVTMAANRAAVEVIAVDDQDLCTTFSRHLSGLSACLTEMTGAAEYLSASYESQLNCSS